jgi:hypothetical protein
VTLFTTHIHVEASHGRKRLHGFLQHWTNYILQQLKRNFADALFRISGMTNSFQWEARALPTAHTV